MRWIQKEVEYLKEKYPTGVSLNDMSNILNKSIKSIQHKAVRLKLSRRNSPINRPKNLNHRNEYDKRYYETNKERIYKNKMARRRRNKIELIELLGGKCNICGYNKCPAAFDFHHNNGNKEKSMSILIKNSSKQQLLKEAKKCIVLCSNCHRELHNKGT
jgi:predicted HNH restriction endonuclease